MSYDISSRLLKNNEFDLPQSTLIMDSFHHCPECNLISLVRLVNVIFFHLAVSNSGIQQTIFIADSLLHP